MIKTATLAVIGAWTIAAPAQAVTLSARDEAARDGAIEWLQLIDAGRYEQATSQASLEAHALEQWMNHFKTQRAPLGRVNRRELFDSKHTSVFPSVPDVRRYHVLRFKTSFEHKPFAIEEIIICKMGCCWEIYEYKITNG